MKSTFGPTVAGRFYPSDPVVLERMVRDHLAGGTQPDSPIQSGRRIVGLIAPHAGYVYSGSVAGYAYAQVANAAIRTVVVLGPSHRVRRSKASTLDAGGYRTPLGDVPIATEVVRSMVEQSSDLIAVDPEVFAPEHSVDVQIPFIRLALPQARLVPIVVPSMSSDRLEALAKQLHERFGNDRHTLLVVSSDLSHFFDYASANRIDHEIVGEIERGEISSLVEHHDTRRGPCGVAPIVVGLEYLKRYGAGGKATTLKLLNSGDTAAGDRSRVVGYPAIALTVPSTG